MPEVINNDSGGGGGMTLIALILGGVVVAVIALFAFGMIPMNGSVRGPAVATDVTRNIDVHVKAPPAIPGTTSTTQSTTTTNQ